ncbi:MAG: ABC transporter permease [Planctomycetota bacterium]|jgi:ABC-type transport system involved in multi-copper enzyme maturation permease subunit
MMCDNKGKKPNMIWKIAKKELLLNLMTFKFAIGAIACVALTSVFMPILAADYHQRLEAYDRNVADNESELREAVVYRNIRHTIYRPPAVLSAFSAGLEKQLAGSAKIELEKVPELSVTQRRGNPYLPILAVFDQSLIFKIIISILALMVAYDTVSGEREQGTLKLVLSGTIARHQVLLGKLLAGLITLGVPVTITFVVGLVILMSSPMVALQGSDWFRIGLMFVASLAFTAVMYLFGLLFSSLARRSAISMVLGLFIWIIFAIVIPNASVHLATRLRPLETQEKRDSRIKSLNEDLANELGKVKVSFSDAIITSDERDAFGGYYAKRRDIYWLNAEQKLNALTIPVKLKYADKSLGIEQSNLNSFFAQKNLARSLSRISPISTYENVMAVLAGTDITSFDRFINQVRDHRNEVIEYVRSSTDNFSSASFFATCSEEESTEYTKLYVQIKEAEDEQAKSGAEQALKEWEQNNPVEAKPLNLQDFPWFKYRPSSAEALRKAIPDLATLFIMNIVLFAACFAAFGRYDVR